MRSITEEDFKSKYMVYKEITCEKQYNTFVAMTESSDGKPFAVVIKEMDEKRAAIYSALTCMWNPHIADTYDVFHVINTSNPDKNRCIAVTEYICAEGSPDKECMSLSAFVIKYGRLSEKTALTVCVQICEALNVFHKKGFVHRDLKPDNIMISKYDETTPQIKIIDFGGAKLLNINKSSDTTVIGTLGYQAPESLSSITRNQSDIYSIGCILSFMLTGQEPGIIRFKGNHRIVSIIEKATNDDPSHRYASVANMKKALEHVLGTRLIDTIPALRDVPGYRSHTLWKENVASLSYVSMIFIAVIAFDKFGLSGLAEIFIFYVIVPLIVIFNMGNLLRYFPENIR